MSVHAVTQLLRRLSDIQFLRFLAVGVLNTAFGYTVLFALMWLCSSSLFAMTLASVIGVLFNFVSNGSLVFRALDWSRLARFLGVYGLVYVYNVIGLMALESRSVDRYSAVLALMPGSVLLTYALQRSLVFATVDDEASKGALT